MIELTFISGGELAKFKIDKKEIFMAGKPTNYVYVKWNPLGLSAEKIAKLKVKKGDDWHKEYLNAENRFREMETEDEIADDLIQDFKKMGMKLIKREKQNGMD